MRFHLDITNRSSSEMLELLRAHNISLNHHAEVLLNSEHYNDLPDSEYVVETFTVAELGFEEQPSISRIHERVLARGYELIPLPLAAHLRLAHLDQRVSKNSILRGQGKAPEGALNVLSPVMSPDDSYPKGLYLRNVDGERWLRGFICDDLYLWNLDSEVAVLCPTEKSDERSSG